MLRFDAERKTYSADIRHRIFGRVHLRLKTRVKDVATRRHTALQLLLDTGEPVRDLVEQLRARKLTIESVEECVRAKQAFDVLRASAWPTLLDARAQILAAVEAKEGSAKTARSIGHALDHAIAFFGGTRRVQSITTDEVTVYRQHLVKPKAEGGAGLASNTAALYLTKLGGLFTFLQRRETRRALQAQRTPAILFNPLDREEHVPTHQQTRVRFLSEAEAERVLAAAPPSLALAFALGIFAGLRIGEVAHLRLVDVELELGVLFIQARKGWHPKYKKNREVPISSALRPYLERHVAQLHERHDTLPEYVFPGRYGKRRGPDYLTERGLTYLSDRVVTDAGLVAGGDSAEGVTFHTLRHTFASWLVMEGVDLLTVARLLGHSSIKQVERTYGHLSPEHRRMAVEHLARRWAAASRLPAPSVNAETEAEMASVPEVTP